jgi:hypothetical protein
MSEYMEVTHDPRRMKQQDNTAQKIVTIGALNLALVQTKLQPN